MMYSPSPHIHIKLPFELCCKLCGYTSHAPKSLTGNGIRSPSLRSLLSFDIPFTVNVCISCEIAHTILPVY